MPGGGDGVRTGEAAEGSGGARRPGTGGLTDSGSVGKKARSIGTGGSMGGTDDTRPREEGSKSAIGGEASTSIGEVPTRGGGVVGDRGGDNSGGARVTGGSADSGTGRVGGGNWSAGAGAGGDVTAHTGSSRGDGNTGGGGGVEEASDMAAFSGGDRDEVAQARDGGDEMTKGDAGPSSLVGRAVANRGRRRARQEKRETSKGGGSTVGEGRNVGTKDDSSQQSGRSRNDKLIAPSHQQQQERAAGGLHDNHDKGRRRKASRAAKQQVREARKAETTEQAAGRRTTIGALKNKLHVKIQKIQVGISKTVIEATRAIQRGEIGGQISRGRYL